MLVVVTQDSVLGLEPGPAIRMFFEPFFTNIS